MPLAIFSSIQNTTNPITPRIVPMDNLPGWLVTALQQYNQAPQQPQQPDEGLNTYGNSTLTMRQRVGLDDPTTNKPLAGPPLTGPQQPTQMAQNGPSQQPSIPIQSPQGAPQSMVTAPNSGLTGFAPPSGPVLGMGGNGGGQFYGLGTQSPSPGPGESPLAGPLLGKQVTPQSAYNSLNAPRIQAFLQRLAEMQKQIPTLRFS